MFERPAFSESTEQGVQGSRAIASHQPEQNASRTADTDVRQVGRLRGSPVQSGAREAFYHAENVAQDCSETAGLVRMKTQDSKAHIASTSSATGGKSPSGRRSVRRTVSYAPV